MQGQAGEGGEGDEEIQTSDVDPINFSEQVERAVRDQYEERGPETGEGSHQDLKNEMRLFKKTKIRNPQLEFIYSNMKNIQVSSVESERSFSAAGRFCNKLRYCLGDRSLGDLKMLH